MTLSKDEQEKIKKRWYSRSEAESQSAHSEPDPSAASAGDSILSDSDKKRISERWNKRFDVDDAYINTFVNDANAFVSRVKSDFNKLDYASATASSSADYYRSLQRTEDDLSTRAWKIQNYLNTHKGDVDEEVYKNFSDYLKAFSSPQFSRQFQGARDYYSQWATADDYAKAMAQQQELEKSTEGYDPVAGKAEERTWLQKGALEEGVNLKNVGRAALGTITDVAKNAGGGLLGIGEKAIDALAWLGNAYAYGQYNQNGGYSIQADQAFRQSHATDTKATEDLIKKDLYDEQALAKLLISSPVEKLTGVSAETDSVLGEKSDALAQSAGQLLGTAALQAAGVPWWLTTGATSFGAEAESALHQGATMSEAGLSAAVSAGAEILTEKLSGGIKFGGRAWDDDIVKPFIDGISNKVVRYLVNLGVDMAGEGAEEILSGIMGAIGQKLSYMDDKSLSELFTSEQAAESFLGGVILGGAGSVVQSVGARKSGTNSTQQPQSAPISTEELTDAIIPNSENAAPGPQQAAQAQQNPVYDIMDEAIAKATNAPADPVGAAVEAFKSTGTVTNKQATDILNSVKAVTQIVEATGVKLPDTASGRRAAVKQAVAELAQKQAAPVDTGTQTDYDKENTQGGTANGTEQANTAPNPGGDGQTVAGIQQKDAGADGYRSGVQGGNGPFGSGAVRPSIPERGAQSLTQSNEPFQSEDYLAPEPGSVREKAQKMLADEYGVSCRIVKKSAWTRNRPAYAQGGVIYISEALSESDYAETVSHELTHVMKQTGFQPYIDFTANTPDHINFRNAATLEILARVAEHRGIDYLAMDDTQLRDLYDELNASMYGAYKSGQLNESANRALVDGVFHDLEGYLKALDGICESYKAQSATHPAPDDSVGMRNNKRQIYNWGIKKDASLDGVGRGTNNRIPHGISSDASKDSISQSAQNVNPNRTPAPDESTGAAPSGYGQNTVGSAESRFKHEQRKSKVYENTYANATDEAIRGIGEDAQKTNPNIGNYDYVSEAESQYNASQRTRSPEEIDYEYEDLLAKDGWTGEDNDTAMRVLAYLRENGDTARLSKLALKQREQGTQGGQLTQSFAKYARTPAYAADSAVVELSAMTAHDIPSNFYKGKTLEAWKGEVSASITDVANQIESVEDGDVEGIKGIIRSLANFRHTTAMFGLRSRLTNAAEAALKDIDFQAAKDIATAQLRQIPNDFRKRSVGQVVKTLRIHNMLSSVATVNRNLVGNSSIGIVDAVSDSTVGRALDALVSLWTKKRTVGNDVKHAKTYFEAASKAAKMASLCAELDIPMESESRYSTGKTRTYSPQGGPVERFMSAYEKYMKYALEVTDKFFEGGTNAAIDESLQALGKNASLSEKEIGQLSEMVGQRRTFKDDRKIARATKGVKKALNEFGTDNIGLGDLAIPFAGTGSNVTQTAIDYTGGGVISGLYEIAKIAKDVKSGKQVDAVRQRQAVTNAARSITGIGLVSAFAALAAKGIIKVHDDDDKDKRALDQSLGLSGAQFNVDAMLRAFAGEDTAWQDGDWTVSIDFLEPFNAQMYVGYILSQEESVQDMVKAYPGAAIQGVAQSVLDMPMMQSLSDTVDLAAGMFESFAKDDDAAATDALGQLLGNYGSGFIPSWLRQTAYMADPYYRDTTGEDALEKSVNQLKSNIPGLSQTLPKKYSGLGEEQLRHNGGISGFFNTYINPGKISQISTSKIADSLDEISEATGSKAIYPDYIAPGSFTYSDENGVKQTVTISGKEMTETYQRTYGEKVASLYSALLSMNEFDALDAETKAAILESTKSYATKLARAAVSDYSEVPAYIKNKPVGMSEAEALVRQKLVGSTEKYTDIPIDSAAYISDVLSSILPETGYSSTRYVQRVEAVTGSTLTERQQKQIMDEVLDDAAYAKYLKILDQGYTNDDYAAALRIYLDSEKTKTQTKKQVIIQEYMDELNLSRAEAEALYKLYSGAK